MKLTTWMSKKGQAMKQMGALAVAIASLAIALAVTFLVLSQAKAQIGSIEGFDATNVTQGHQSLAYNSTSTLQSAVDDIPTWIPLIVIAVIGSILLGLVALFRT
tara:strand:- start:656 stop:967 length:312 start_codon:yes stop_codon:yes gene_type:complete